MHIRQGVYLRLAERLQLKYYSRVSKIVLSGIVCLVIISSAVLLFKNTFATPPCPCTVFTVQTPTVQPGLYNQAGGIEVGMKFKVSQSGYISGARFYKVAGMTGTHTASIWNSMGVRLATATFTNESATGWQEINFTPIVVTANAVYTVSVFMDDGNYAATSNYFNVPVLNEPFNVPQDGQVWDGLGHGGPGVYSDLGSSVYPYSSFNATNYWIDTVYISSPSSTAPTVTAKSPLAGSTDIAVSDAVSATFDKRLLASSVSADTFVVSGSQGQVLPGVVSYDQNTSTVKFIADELLKTNATYTATLKGGTGNVITDYDGHALGADYEWSFTTSSTPLICPCSLKHKLAPSEATTYTESYPDGLELGLKIVPSANGYITAIRFYKPIINQQMTHVGSIWDASGNNLASVTFNNESEYGWQEAMLSAPLAVAKDQVYIVSFGMTNAIYTATINGLSSALTSPGFAAYPSGESRNAALGSGTANSVYSLTSGMYPSNPASSNQDYVIDAVFTLQSDDIEPLRVTNTQPSTDSNGVKRDAVLQATFDQGLDQSTVNPASVQVRNATGLLVAGQAAYDTQKRAITFDPTADLISGERYVVTITTAVKDIRGESLPVEHSWSFTTGRPAAIDMNEGNGGPILVVTSSGDSYSKYYAEILRTEGLNYFDVREIDDVTPVTLDGYRAVILGAIAITQSHADMLQTWVADGGAIVAMRPDKKLSGLLGLEDTGATMVNSYMKVNNATVAGLGIANEPMQYKGAADVYAADDATTVAMLYSDANSPTVHPAVTTRSIGEGTAMSFSYDLARSVIGLHQGNQTWSGVDRNFDGVVRTNDLFFGAATFDMQTDWLDNNKMDTPQADEQQRLLVNLLTDAMSKKMPAPRFWYLPNEQKAAIVLAGDDHGWDNNSGTQKQMNALLNKNTIGCSVMDWECARATHYIYANSELSATRARQFVDYGFEIGSHPMAQSGNCDAFQAYGQLIQDYSDSLSSVRVKYASLPNQRTVRFHCYAWPSWDWMSRADGVNGIRYDLNSVAYPSSWVGARSPMVTGSGMNMRLTDTGGNLLDVRQGVTNFDNITAGTASIAAALDNALGVKGYYGIFGSHYDMTDTYDVTLYALALSRQVPLITADQALTWLDGRSGSNFSNLASSETGKVTFTLDVAEGAYGLRAMMPMRDANGELLTIKRAGQLVAYQTKIIKGVSYAIFKAQPGPHEVIYSDYGTTPPIPGQGSTNVIVGTSPRLLASTAKVDEAPTESHSGDDAPSRSLIQPRDDMYTSSPTKSGEMVEEQKWWRGPILGLFVTASASLVLIGGGVWWLARLRR